MHPTQFPDEKLLEDCRVERTKRGGPGGQHRNKVESAIVITHLPTGIIGQASERRSQHANRDVAIERLRLNLAIGFRLEIDSDSEPNELWRSRTRGGKVVVSVSHRDFAAVLAEAFNYIVACDFEISSAAKRLGVSTSQLIKLLAQHRPALEFVNRERQTREMSRLKA